jgi:preprotein translocase subunit Sec61beta
MSLKRKKNDSALPASSAGLLRFFEDETEGVKIRPEFVIISSVSLMLISIIIRIFIPA